MNTNTKVKNLKVVMEADVESGVYANLAMVIHSDSEFLVDFGLIQPNRETVRIGSRVVMTPKTAKQLLLALNQNIQKYEEQFGEIALPKSQIAFTQGKNEFAQ